jgi:Protein of unknown function (DUF1036)
MSLTFVNQYSFTPGYDLYVAFMCFDRASCSDGDGFITIGWYQVPPGGSHTVYNGDVNYNRYWAYYAECPKDGATWSGNVRGWVNDSPFRLCHGRSCTDPLTAPGLNGRLERRGPRGGHQHMRVTVPRVPL